MTKGGYTFLVFHSWDIQARVGCEEAIRFERKPDVVHWHPTSLMSQQTKAARIETPRQTYTGQSSGRGM